MEHAIEQINGLISRIESTFPDEQDLKGFAGISKAGMLDVLRETGKYLSLLIPHNNEVETIFLKREVADLVERTLKEVGDKFDRIKSSVFNSILKNIVRIKFQVKETYISLVQSPIIRTEAQITAANAELQSLNNLISAVKTADLSLKNQATVISEQMASSLKTVSGMKDSVSALTENTVQKATIIVEEMKGSREKASAILTDVELRQKKAVESEQKMDAFLLKMETTSNGVETINKNSTLWQQQIKDAKDGMVKNVGEYDSFLKRMISTQLEIEGARDKILGRKEGDKVILGFIQETEILKGQLVELLKDYSSKYSLQLEQIESLLPGATTAGLTEAFEKQKRSYDKPILLWSWVFISVTILMTASSMYLFYVQFISRIAPNETWEHGLLALLRDLPFFIPTIWLAVFASKQQSQFKRLQQEYAFKEINAKSFYGHKKQIEELNKTGNADTDLLAQMVRLLVYITAENPSATLDNKAHDDAPPLFSLLKELNPLGWKKGKETGKAASMQTDKTME